MSAPLKRMPPFADRRQAIINFMRHERNLLREIEMASKISVPYQKELIDGGHALPAIVSVDVLGRASAAAAARVVLRPLDRADVLLVRPPRPPCGVGQRRAELA